MKIHDWVFYQKCELLDLTTRLGQFDLTVGWHLETWGCSDDGA